MDYGKFIKILKGVPVDADTQQRIWLRVSHTISKNRSGISLFDRLWPKYLVPAAALAIIFIIYFYNYSQQMEMRTFAQHINSTEYIYEVCSNDGFLN
jgi:hypothetical protein